MQKNVCVFKKNLAAFQFNEMLFCNHQQDNYSYGCPAAVTTYDNKQFYQTSIATTQRTHTESYYQTGESAYLFISCCIHI